MMNSLVVMAGGAIGALGRYQLGRMMGHLMGLGFSWGTLSANILGGLLMGLIAGMLSRVPGGGEPIRLFLAVGMLGGFTTFSSFSLEVMLMIERGEYGVGIAYVLASVIGAVAALALGLGIARVTA